MAHNHRQYRSPFGDTTYTKVFVGGLPWETPTERMREYFEQFGDILEAVIIGDRSTGKSKGYGFVTFVDPESATRACADPNPMIDGRRANCNIASFGRPRPSPPRSRNEGGIGQETLPLMQTIQPHPPANPFFYQGYGCTAYTPGYGYHQALYNPQQYHQLQYYTQLYGSSTSSSINMSNPYPYGYPLPSSRATLTIPSYNYNLYFPTMQMEGSSPSAYDNSSPWNSLHNPPTTVPAFSPATRQHSSSSTDSQAKQCTPVETEAEVITTEGGSNS